MTAIEVRFTGIFVTWLDHLRDREARARIVARIRRLECGNPGQIRNLTGGVSEMKIDHGPGYRLYFTRRGSVLVVLLCGGDKTTQDRDIQTAMRLAGEV